MSERPLVNDWTTDWDYQTPQYHQDAPKVWAELREHCPVAHTARYGGAWALVRFDDVSAAAHDPATFSSRHTGLLDEYPERQFMLPLNLDPPEHAALRRVLLPTFGPRAVADLEEVTTRTSATLLDRLAGRVRADAAGDFARHVPVGVTAAMLGVPDRDEDRFRSWLHDIVERPDEPETLAAALRDAFAYFDEQIDRRRSQPGDDMISRLAQSEIDGAPIPRRALTATALTLLLGGIDTVWSVLGAALLHLATHPDDQARLRREPELIGSAIEEFLRYYAPVDLARLVTRDTEVDGIKMTAGEHVWLSFPAANRDPAAFPEPDRVILDRSHNRHMAFGVGVHRCIGSNLARMELRVALSTWLQRIPTFQLAEDADIEWTTGGGVRGPRSVPIDIKEPTFGA